MENEGIKIETDICIHCNNPIFWGPGDEPKKIYNPAYAGGWRLRHWRHKETRSRACSWKLPIKFAKPKSGQLSKDQIDFLKRNHIPEERWLNEITPE